MVEDRNLLTSRPTEIVLKLLDTSSIEDLQVQILKINVLADWKSILEERTTDNLLTSQWEIAENIQIEISTQSIQVVLSALDVEGGIHIVGFVDLSEKELEDHDILISVTFHIQHKTMLYSVKLSGMVERSSSAQMNDGLIAKRLLAEENDFAFKLVSIVPDTNLHKPEVLHDIGEACRQRFRTTRDLLDINAALRAYEEASKLVPVDLYDHRRFLHAVGLSLTLRYGETGSFQDIDKAVATLKHVVDRSSEEDAEIIRWLNNLGSGYLSLFGHSGSNQYLESAISILRKAISLAPEGDIHMISSLNNLGNALMNRAERTLDIEDIDDAISLQRKAVSLTSAGDWDLPGRMNNLGNSILTRFELSNDVNDIGQAIPVLETAIYITPDGHPALPVELNTLSSLLLARFSHEGQLTDLEAAISALERAKTLTGMDHPGMRTLLTNLGNAYRICFEESGEIRHLEGAISVQRQTITLIPVNHSSMPLALHFLAYSLCREFERTGSLDHVNEAVSLIKEAIHLTPDDNPNAPIWLHTLGTLLWKRFERNGQIHDIDESIYTLQTAVHLTPDTSTDLALHLDSLGIALLRRCEQTGTFGDVEEAHNALQKSASLIHEGHADLPRRLTNLGNAIFCRFQETKAMEDIDACISTFRRALQLTPEGHADTCIRLANLGNSLQCRFEMSDDIETMKEANAILERALKLTPDGHASLPARLKDLGNSLRRKYSHSKDIADINQAIEFQKKAVELTPANHADATSRLNDLGNSYKDRFAENKDIIDIKAAASSYRAAAISVTGSPSLRLKTARMWAISCSFFDLQESLVAYEAAFSLLPRVAWIGETIVNRQERLMPVADFVNDAASAAIRARRYDIAVEWLEEGRCLIWNQINNLRTPLDKLRSEHPTLAEDIVRVSKSLEYAGVREMGLRELSTGSTARISMEYESQSHHRMAEEWEALVNKVRNLDGFEDFLCPTPFSKLSSLVPSTGSVVAINVAPTGCDALILTQNISQPVSVKLDTFSQKKAEYLQKCLENCLITSGLLTRDIRSGRLAKQPTRSSGIAFILEELWKDVVKPILGALAYQPSDNPPRIWWCATGPLALLPIHAAGVYLQGNENRNLCQYAISSYIPTLRSILRENAHRISEKLSISILIVSQPDCPGLPPLPNAEKEVRKIQEICSRSNVNSTVLEGKAATVEKVLRAMETVNWIHLACHASQDANSAMRSGFYLHDGRLELSRLIKQPFSQARLAFLSACQTAAGDKRMPEEAVHLAAGMLSSGYDGVIATMWAIKDEDAPFIAQEVYSHLLRKNKIMFLADSSAAEALHYAVLKLREKLGESEDSLLSCIPFIHFGI